VIQFVGLFLYHQVKGDFLIDRILYQSLLFGLFMTILLLFVLLYRYKQYNIPFTKDYLFKNNIDLHVDSGIKINDLYDKIILDKEFTVVKMDDYSIELEYIVGANAYSNIVLVEQEESTKSSDGNLFSYKISNKPLSKSILFGVGSNIISCVKLKDLITN